MKIGQYNRLKVARTVDFGVYLTGGDADGEVLMPARYIEKPLKEGQEVEVFVYRDSENRPVAVTERPFATVGEFAFLQVVDVNKIGAFLDWGLQNKNLLVPFSEQKARMREGGIYLVYVYVDHTTGRIVASAKIEKFLDNVFPRLKPGYSVNALVYKHTDLGYACIVNNLHRGMIYEDELYRPLEIGETIKASIRNVRSDGRLDLTPGGSAKDRTNSLANEIFEAVSRDGKLSVTEKSTPEEIKDAFSCSKKDFKKAIGHLLKEHKVSINIDGSIVSATK